MATDDLDLGLMTGDVFELSSPDICQCEFLQWGSWGGDIQLNSEIGDDSVLAYWVAGEVSSLAEITALSGSADYSGHIIGIVNDGTIFPAVGGFDVQDYVFATGSGDFTVTQFDNVSYSGTLTGGGAGFTGSGFEDGAEPDKSIDLNGAFFSGGGDPAAQVGGGFSINGDGYEASGIFAADKQP